MSGRRKATPGHKLVQMQIGFQSRCECGWASAWHMGKGSRSQANAEFLGHLINCLREAGDPQWFRLERPAKVVAP